MPKARRRRSGDAGLQRGVFRDGHVGRMSVQGFAVFGWLVERQPTPGAEMRFTRGAVAANLGISTQTVKRALHRLNETGYISLRWSKTGYIVKLTKERKFYSDSQGVESDPSRARQGVESDPSRGVESDPFEPPKGSNLTPQRVESDPSGGPHPCTSTTKTTVQTVDEHTTEDFKLSSPPPGKNKRKMVGPQGELLRFFDERHLDVMKLPYLCKPPRDVNLLNPLIKRYGVLLVHEMMDCFWKELESYRRTGEGYTGRKKPDIPGFVSAIPSLIRDWKFDNGGPLDGHPKAK